MTKGIRVCKSRIMSKQSFTVSDLTQIVIPKVTSSSPPSYGEIHLYKQLDATCCSPDYNTVSGMSVSFEISGVRRIFQWGGISDVKS